MVPPQRTAPSKWSWRCGFGFSLVVWLGLAGLPESVAAAEVVPAATKAFLAQYCVECHDAETKKGNLDLTQLPAELADPSVFERWVLVHDRVRAGEMPPEKKKRPKPAELVAAMDALAAGLRSANQQRQQTEGRVTWRRLNRAEYEYTLRDVFDQPFLELKDLLPADGSAQGFDNVSEGLMLSPAQIGGYLEAGEAALRSALYFGPKPAARHFEYSFTNLARTANQIGWSRFMDRNAVMLRQQPPQSAWFNVNPLRLSVAGFYRVRLKAFGATLKDGQWGPADRPHSVLVFRWDQPVASLELPANEARPLEFTCWWEPGQTFSFQVVTLDPTSVRHPFKNLGPFTGPVVAFESFEMDGPLVETWPPVSYQTLLGDLTTVDHIPRLPCKRPPATRYHSASYSNTRFVVMPRDRDADGRRLLRSFLEKIMRRPVPEDAEKPYWELARSCDDGQTAFQEMLLPGWLGILTSPDFLFLDEKPGRLDDWALAARLSYFLIKSTPDEPLRKLAAAGQLHEPAILDAQVDRLLDDPRSSRFLEEFLGQWLDLRRLGATEPDPRLYPEFDAWLQNSMKRETLAFFAELIRQNLSTDHLIQSDFAMVNQRLAQLYGLPEITGDAIRRVAVPTNSPRGSLLGQASILKVTANGTTTSPVTRGAWIRTRLLGLPVPPPPAGIGAIDPDVRGATTIREQLAKHRSNPACASCHTRMDPPGFALESFDVIGGGRDHYRSLGAGDEVSRVVFGLPVAYRVGPKVDASGVTEHGQPFANFLEFRRQLLKEREQVARNLVQQLVTFATGAGIQFADRDEIEEILRRTRSENWGVRTLIHEVVRSPMFLHK